jgi:hypothetical protein
MARHPAKTRAYKDSTAQQLRAAVLSQDDRLARFFANRPGCAYRWRPLAD